MWHMVQNSYDENGKDRFGGEAGWCLLKEEMCHSVALSVFCASKHVKWKTGGLSPNDSILVLFLPKLFLSSPVIQHYAF